MFECGYGAEGFGFGGLKWQEGRGRRDCLGFYMRMNKLCVCKKRCSKSFEDLTLGMRSSADSCFGMKLSNCSRLLRCD